MPETSPNFRVARSGVVDQWTSGIRPTWSVDQVKSALYDHQTGTFAQSALLAEAMYADDELPTSLDRAVNQIVGAEFSLNPVTDAKGEPIALSEVQAETLLPHWETSYPEHELAKLVRWFLMLGVAVGTIDWVPKGDVWKPYLRTLHPEFLYWDPETVDPDSGLYGVFKYTHRGGDTEIVRPGNGKWVLLSDGRESWMRCSIRALATTWLVKQYAWRDWQRYNERHGLPIVKAKVPVMADDKAAFFNKVKSLSRDTTVLLPSGIPIDAAGQTVDYDLELLEAKDQAYGTYETVIARCDRKMQLHFLGTNTAEMIGTAGSRATSEQGRNASQQLAAERERRIVTDLREQLVRPFVAFNIPGADPELNPWPHFLVEGKEDATKSAEAVKLFGEALVSIKAAQYEVSNAEELALEFGLKLEKAEAPETDTVAPPDTERDETEDNAPETEREPEGEQLAQLQALDSVEDVGKRDGAVAAQAYLDELVEYLSAQADALEETDAETMARIVTEAESPEDLRRRVSEYANSAAPVELAALYEKAILLAQLAGRFAIEEDL